MVVIILHVLVFLYFIINLIINKVILFINLNTLNKFNKNCKDVQVPNWT